MANNELKYRLSLQDLFTRKMEGAIGSTKKMDGAMSGLGSRIRGVIGTFATAALAKSVIDTTAKFQSFDNAIKTASGSAAAGQKNLAFLNEQVDKLGLDINAAYAGYKTFSGALMGTALEGDRANTVFRQVSEAATVMGLSGEQTEGAFLALGQMMSKGTVSAEELRGQLGERIPGAFQIAARAMGVTTMQLGEMMKAGEVISEDFLPKFGAELERTFGGKVSSSTNSLQANLNRLDASWERLKVTLGTAVLPTIIKVTNALTSLLNVLPKLLPFIKMGITLWGAYYLKMKLATIESGNFALAQRAVAMGMSKSAVATGFLKRGIQGIGTAIKGVPIIGWIALIVEGIQYLWQNFEGLRSSVYRAWETFANFGKFLTGLFTGIGNIMKGALYGMPETIRLGVEQMKAGALETKLSAESGVKQRIKAYNEENGLASSPLESDMNKLAPGASSAGAAKGTSSTSSGSSTEFSGARPQSVIINIHDGLVKNMNITAQTIKESAVKIREEVTKALLESANDANTIGMVQ